MLNKIFRYTLPALAFGAVAILSSCDIVPENSRYIATDPVPVERCVLLEDFTGQNCVNCPEAHEIIEQLQKQYGDNFIPVSIHAGAFAMSVNRTNYNLVPPRIGLMTKEGNDMAQAYGITKFPMGVINMGSPVEMEDWPTKVEEAIKVPSDISIKTTVALNEEATELNITSEILSQSERTAYVQFWVLEDGIVAVQKNIEGEEMQDYVHNNVFRAQLFNGEKGEKTFLTPNTVQPFDTSIEIRYTDKELWTTPNLSVVTIVSDDSGVLQCARTYLTPRDNTGDSEEDSE